jgi:serine/threonine protein kinase/tetratricopeptide (TPR) repeat protein
MTPERWQRVKELFQSALAQQQDGRAAFLANACADDASLRVEVESLVAAYEADPDSFEQPAHLSTQPSSGAGLAEPDAVRRIGPYELIRVIASGGMGTVYLAARADDEYHKHVAIKVIRSDPYGDPRRRDELRKRFRNERQLLANLDHPNIARLLDGGTLDDGLPYLVMEHIDGQPIDVYADEQRLSTVQRLRLFRTVCSAVHYAHQNLLVHRDLKPSNILVTRDGVPQLLDFGVAKLLDPDSSDLAGGLTQTGVQPMTPTYASPEQLRGLPVTTASDVYSLGVILYELLTGHRPYQIANQPPHEVARVICEQEPEKPSTAVTRTKTAGQPDDTSHVTLTPESVSRTRELTPERLRRRLKGDLDMIVLMALRKEPQRRYASVEQFSEDIRRHLDGLPVLARKDTFAYRSAKFVRRHKTGVVMSTLSAVALVAAVVTTSWQAVVADRERDVAQQQTQLAQESLRRAEAAEQQSADDAETARTVAAFLADLFAAADPIGALDPTQAKGADLSVGEVLERGVERIRTDLRDQPRVQAALMHTLGGVRRQLGDFDRAAPLLEEALEIRRREYGDESLYVAESLRDRAELLRDQGRLTEAESVFREALDLERRLLGDEHPDIAVSMEGLALVLKEARDYAQAESLYRDALALQRRTLGERHPQVAATLVDMAGVLQAAGKLDEAEQLQVEALDIFRELHGDDHPEVAATLCNMAVLRHAQGDFEQAEVLYGQAINIYRRVLPEDHPYISRNLNNLGWLLVEKRAYAEAEPLLRESLALRRKRFGNQHTEVATSLNNLALCLRGMGEFEEAEALLRESLGIIRATLHDEHPAVAQHLNNLAHVLLDLGRYDEATELLRESLAIRQRTHPDDQLSIANAESGLGTVLLRSGQADEAEPLLRDALDVRRRMLPDGHWLAANSASVLGECLAALGHYEEAETLLLESYPVIESALGDRHERTLQALQRIADMYEAWGRSEDAARYRALSESPGTP